LGIRNLVRYCVVPDASFVMLATSGRDSDSKPSSVSAGDAPAVGAGGCGIVASAGNAAGSGV
jgi:hypothetical protein